MKRPSRVSRDWDQTLARVSGGDRTAFLELARLLTGFLASWRAYDFRDEWDDLVQEVILTGIEAHRTNRIRKRGAALGYLRSAARFKFVDWLRRQRTESLPDEGGRPLETVCCPPLETPAEGGFQIWDRVRELPPKVQRAILLVYVEELTYEEASARSGIPLGSLKRYLRDGLATLRESLADFCAPVGPNPT
jgi:RNA polymerase sigma-70 factor, ECF subfamily